jgi:PEP-CTERM motif
MTPAKPPRPARWPGRLSAAVLPVMVMAMAMATTTAAPGAPLGWVLNTNQTIHLVNLASNADLPAGGIPFASDSLAVNPSGTLYSADPVGVLWDVTGPPIPVGPTGRTQIADLDWAANGLWGYSNASQELFFFDIGLGNVSYSQTITLPAGLVVTGVAHQPAGGDLYLSAAQGLNNDTLWRVPASATSALLVGTMAQADSFSFISDIDFDAGGTLHAMTWFHRWFYTVSTASAATSLLSAGPHRDTTGLALLPVPEPGSALMLGLGLALLGPWVACRRRATTRIKAD